MLQFQEMMKSYACIVGHIPEAYLPAKWLTTKCKTLFEHQLLTYQMEQCYRPHCYPVVLNTQNKMTIIHNNKEFSFKNTNIAIKVAVKCQHHWWLNKEIPHNCL